MEYLNNDGNLENLKAKIDDLKAGTLYKLIMNDKQYNKIATEQRKAEKAYMKLKLSKKQRKIIDTLLSKTDEMNMEENTYSYLAGIYDSDNAMVIDTLKFRKNSDQENKLPLFATERTAMDALRELYIISSELKQAEDALKESDKQLFDYMKSKFSEEEKLIFYDTINSIMRIREEYFFKTGFKTAVKLLSECL